MPKKERFKVIHALRKTFRLCWLLEIAGVSRQGYHKWCKQSEHMQKRQALDQELKSRILTIHKLHTQLGFGEKLKGRRDPMSYFRTKMQVNKGE